MRIRCRDHVRTSGVHLRVVGAKGFEPSTSWSRTKHNYIDLVSLNLFSLAVLTAKLDPNMDPI
jgi:hypothetical protein